MAESFNFDRTDAKVQQLSAKVRDMLPPVPVPEMDLHLITTFAYIGINAVTAWINEKNGRDSESSITQENVQSLIENMMEGVCQDPDSAGIACDPTEAATHLTVQALAAVKFRYWDMMLVRPAPEEAA